MKYRSSIIIAALLALFCFQVYKSEPVYDQKEGLILHGLMQFIEQVHFDPRPVDDEFSKEVFDKYLERIDPDKRYFTQSDIKELKKYYTDIDDQVKRRSFEFFDLSLVLLEKRMKQGHEFYDELIEKKYDLNSNDRIELDNEKIDFAKNDAELKKGWEKFLKYQMITRIDNKLRNQKDDEDKKSMDEIIEETRTSVKENFEDWFTRIEKYRREDRFESYLSAISNYFDPHTEYFNPKEKASFDISMSGKLEGIGARLQQDGDYIKVESIVAGGPAWKAKNLEVDDQIRSVAQSGKEPVDITGMRLDDVVAMIRGKKGTTVLLTIRKKSGVEEQISIVRDEVILDEGLARATIMEIPGEVGNIGYIYLPRFYSSFERENGISCAKDVEKLIERLKKEDVNGIILDLRNNGGGSLQDVVDMSGLFIKEGPIVQVKSRDTKPSVHYDKDESVQYSGPLILMVNHFSASASEIIAAAMQDYKRAIIVGSTTYGKGTVQRFFDLDRALRGNNEFKPLGELKLTMQKFYRINGASTQFKGVIPDIPFVDNFEYMEVGEREYDSALEYSEIDPQNYTQDIVHLDHVEKVKQASLKRMKGNETFTLVDETAKRFKENRDMTSYPLNLKEYQAMMEKRTAEAKKYEGVFDKEIENLVVRNLPNDIESFKGDQSKIGRNQEWLKELKSDFYLYETLLIMKDMIEQEASFATISEKMKIEERN